MLDVLTIRTVLSAFLASPNTDWCVLGSETPLLSDPLIRLCVKPGIKELMKSETEL